MARGQFPDRTERSLKTGPKACLTSAWTNVEPDWDPIFIEVFDISPLTRAVLLSGVRLSNRAMGHLILSLLLPSLQGI